MHEYSLAKRILAQASEVAAEHSNRRLEAIVLSIGPLSGVEPFLLTSAFAQVAVEEGQATVRLMIEESPLSISCNDCQSISELIDFHFCCHVCGGDQVRVLSGEQVILKSVELSIVSLKEENSCLAK